MKKQLEMLKLGHNITDNLQTVGQKDVILLENINSNESY